MASRYEGPYRAEVGPGGAADLPGAPPAAFGAQIGAAVGEAGEALERRRRVKIEVAREHEMASAGQAFATLQGELERASVQARERSDPGAPGHTEEIDGLGEDAETNFMATLRDPQVRRFYEVKLREMRTRLTDRENGWEVGQRVEHSSRQLEKMRTQMANNLTASSATAEDWTQALMLWGETVRAFNLPGNAEVDMEEGGRRVISLAYANMLVENNPAALQEALDRGLFNESGITSADIGVLRNSAGVETRRRDMEVRAAAAEYASEVRERLRLFSARIASGDVPSDEEFAQHAALAAEIGADVDLFNVGVQRAEASVNREFRTSTASQREAELNRLAALGDRRTTDDNVRYAQLQRLHGPMSQAENNDPHQAARNRGRPAPPVDFDNPTRAQIDARIAWADADALQNGRAVPAYLSENDKEALRRRAGPDLPGQLNVAAELRANWGADRAFLIAQDIAPSNQVFRLATQLPRDSAAAVVRGISARAARPDIFRDAPLESALGTSAGADLRGVTVADARRLFAEVAGAVPQDMRETLLNAAMNIAAGTADTQGHPFVSEGVMRMALHRAAGSTGRNGRRVVGGFHWYNGAPVWLPNDMAPEDFDRRVTRASAAALQAASGSNGIFYPGREGRGAALTFGDWSRVRFMTLAPGVYQAIGPQGGYLLTDQGAHYVIDVRRLP